MSRITKTDYALIRKFNFYIKNADLENFNPKEVVFKIEKVKREKPDRSTEIQKETLVTLQTSVQQEMNDLETSLKREDCVTPRSVVFLKDDKSENVVLNSQTLQILSALQNLVAYNNLFTSIMNVPYSDIFETYRTIGLLSNLDRNNV